MYIERERERPLTHSASICNYSSMNSGWRYVICGFYHPWQLRTMKVNSSHRWELIPLFIYSDTARGPDQSGLLYSEYTVKSLVFSPGPEFIDPAVKWQPQVTVFHVRDYTEAFFYIYIYIYKLLHLKDLDSKKHRWGWVARLQHVTELNIKWPEGDLEWAETGTKPQKIYTKMHKMTTKPQQTSPSTLFSWCIIAGGGSEPRHPSTHKPSLNETVLKCIFEAPVMQKCGLKSFTNED